MEEKDRFAFIDKSIGEEVGKVNKAFFRLKYSLYHLLFFVILTPFTFFIVPGIISLIFIIVTTVVLIFVVVAFQILKDKRLKLKIMVLIVKETKDLKGFDRRILENHLSKLEPQEYLPSWVYDFIFILKNQ